MNVLRSLESLKLNRHRAGREQLVKRQECIVEVINVVTKLPIACPV